VKGKKVQAIYNSAQDSELQKKESSLPLPGVPGCLPEMKILGDEEYFNFIFYHLGYSFVNHLNVSPGAVFFFSSNRSK